MKRLINKIVIKIDKEKIKDWLNSKKGKVSKRFSKDPEHYICRVCKHLYPEKEMNEEDKSICKDCSKHD